GYTCRKELPGFGQLTEQSDLRLQGIPLAPGGTQLLTRFFTVRIKLTEPLLGMFELSPLLILHATQLVHLHSDDLPLRFEGSDLFLQPIHVETKAVSLLFGILESRFKAYPALLKRAHLPGCRSDGRLQLPDPVADAIVLLLDAGELLPGLFKV